MFRETLQALACLSVLASTTYSLHMSSNRGGGSDTYHRAANGGVIGLNSPGGLNDFDELPLADQSLQNNQRQKLEELNDDQLSIVASENEIQESIHNLKHPLGPLGDHEPPRALQELFGGGVGGIGGIDNSGTLDIRLEQKEQKKIAQQKAQQQQQQHQPSKYAVNTKRNGGEHNVGGNINGGSSISSPNLPPIPHGLASQLMLRTARGQRQYDVPQIGKFDNFTIFHFPVNFINLFLTFVSISVCLFLRVYDVSDVYIYIYARRALTPTTGGSCFIY